MDRDSLLEQWDQLWKEGLWTAPLSAALEDLTPRQAAWRPEVGLPDWQHSADESGGRHSIWQIVNHMLFWREVALRRAAGGPGPGEQEVASRNWDAPEGPMEATEANWSRTLQQLADSQQQVRSALQNPGVPLDRLAKILPHDCYHLGQIMMLRGMMGLKPIE